MNKKFYIELIFLIIIGALTSLSLPPFNYLIINFLTFSLFFLFLINKSNQHKNTKLFFFYGWLYGFGYFVSNLYWISISLSFDQSFKFLIPLTIILIPAILALFYGIITFLFIVLKPNKLISSFLIFSLLFGIFEFIRGITFTGFPWNIIAYSFSNQLEILSIISIIGTYSFNLICITLFTSPALLFLRESKKEIVFCISLFFVFVLFYFHGFIVKKKFNQTDVKILDYKVRVIASNISLDRFYKNVDTISVIEDLMRISEPNSTNKTIFVWPEGIIPNVYQDSFSEYKEVIEQKFSKNQILIIGINKLFKKDNKKKYFNSLSVYDNKLNLINSYSKINLVPFGEFLPFEKILKKFGLRSLTNNYQSFTSGNERNIININQDNFSLKILPLICYEVIYSGQLYESSNFDLIVNISEDGWFGQSIGPEQHFVHSIFRSIESGKYLVRSANNGVTAIVNPIGNVEQRVNKGNTGYLDLKEIKRIQPTIFSKYGNKIFGLLILLYIFLLFSFNRINNE